MVGGSSAQTNANAASPPIDVLPGARWTYTAPAEISEPIVVDGTVYFTAEDAQLYAVDATTGREQWRTRFADSAGGTPAFVDGGLLVRDLGETVYRVAADTGEVLWESSVGSESSLADLATGSPSPVIASDLAYVTTDTELYAIDVATGTHRWIREIGVDGEGILTRPAISDGRVVVGEWQGSVGTSREDIGVQAFDAFTGEREWANRPGTRENGISRIRDTPALTADAAFVTSERGDVHRLDLETGDFGWTRPLEEGYGSPSGVTIAGSIGCLYVDRSVLALSLETGRERWRNPIGESMSALRPTGGSEQFYTAVSQELWALDSATGERQWAYSDIADLSPVMAVADGTVYVVDESSIVAVDADGGQNRQRGATANESLVAFGAVASVLLSNLYAILRSKSD